ncbi:TPA: acetate--CoA ligase family protein [archaeon]|nr:acetate--CoA ligase family protein [Candidatus Naiadarchaeales archaeon SRR2090159.bin1288]
MPKSEVSNIFKKVRSQKRNALTAVESAHVLAAYGIPVAKSQLITKKEELAKIKFPVALKVISPDLVHKTESATVAVGIKTLDEANLAYDTLISNAKKAKRNVKIDGILVQEMLSGTELIVGSSRDAQFGQTIMFGIGGIFVEVMKDVTFRVNPITKTDAAEMLDEVKAKKVLDGVRGKAPVNKNAVLNILLKTSQLLQDCPQIKELDINPLFAGDKDARAADARIILE